MVASKRFRALTETVNDTEFYPINEAITLAKSTASAKFDESMDVSVNLGVDARKSDQSIRGSTVLPRGTGKKVKVAVFADGAQADEATESGADVVGLNDLAEQVQKGEYDFDIVIATPDSMKIVGKLGQILGPRGLMPNPKVGTVTTDVAKAVRNAKAGQVQFRNDKAGIVHCSIGKASFDVDALRENFDALLLALQKAKPAAAKGQYFKRVTLSTTMGPGIRVDRASLPV